MLGEEVPVLPVFSWIRLHNEGAAFSILADQGGWQRWFFVTLAIGVFDLSRRRDPPLAGDRTIAGVGLSLRARRRARQLVGSAVDGYVVDFALVHYGNHYFPAFNVADSAISIGATFWILSMLRDMRRERAARTT